MIPPLQATTSLFALSIFTFDWFYNSATKSTLFCCATSIAVRSQYLLESFQHAHLSLGAPTFHDACDLADQFWRRTCRLREGLPHDTRTCSLQELSLCPGFEAAGGSFCPSARTRSVWGGEGPVSAPQFSHNFPAHNIQFLDAIGAQLAWLFFPILTSQIPNGPTASKPDQARVWQEPGAQTGPSIVFPSRGTARPFSLQSGCDRVPIWILLNVKSIRIISPFTQG